MEIGHAQIGLPSFWVLKVIAEREESEDYSTVLLERILSKHVENCRRALTDLSVAALGSQLPSRHPD